MTCYKAFSVLLTNSAIRLDKAPAAGASDRTWDPAARRSDHLRAYAFVALFLLSCIVSCSSLIGLVRLLTQQSEYAHIALVLPIVAGLIYLARASIVHQVDSALPIGIAVMGGQFWSAPFCASR